MSGGPVAIVGGGPVGLTLALLLAHRGVSCAVVDARTVEEAARDRRLLALSRGTLDTLEAVAALPAAALAPIRSVVVSSQGEFGCAVFDEREGGGRPLGATIRYGELVVALDAACRRHAGIELRRPCAVTALRQSPDRVEVLLADGSLLQAEVAVNAEGGGPVQVPVQQAALIGDVEVEGPLPGTAFERFTRDGPLALLPVAGPAGTGARTMALVWCMPATSAERRERLSDAALLAEMQAELGPRNGRLRSIRARGRYPLLEHARDTLREHRIVYVGNAAQSLHPVAGQGLNLGARDCVALADALGAAAAAGEDAIGRLAGYEQARRADRWAIRTLTRTAPGFFATRFAPVAAARSLGLTLLSIFPDLRREFARLLMFGVRS